MMKRFFNIIFVALASFSFGGCTLMMDDLEKEEEEAVDLEEVGFDEPYTQKTEYGDLTFQYGDSTRVLRKESLNYLVKVSCDTILYFSDNIPEHLLVPEGMYVSMGCTEQIRHGLCSKVLSLTRENGMVKMVTSRAPQSVVFKQLDMDLSLEYDQQMGFDPFHNLEEQGLINENGDTVYTFTDWAFFGDATVKRKKEEIARRINAQQQFDMLTRADKDDKPKDEDTGERLIKDKCVTLFSISAKDLDLLHLLGMEFIAAGDIGSSTDFNVSLGFHETTTLRHIQKVSNGQDYVRDSYKETSFLAFSAKFLYKNTQTLNSLALYNEVLKYLKSKKKPLNIPSFTLNIPIPVVTAFEFFIKIDPVVSVNLGLTGQVEFTQGMGVIEKVVEYDNGTQVEGGTKFNVSKEKNSEFKFNKFDVCGKFELEVGISVLEGVGTTGGTLGLGFGISLTGNLTFQRTFPHTKSDGGSLDVLLKPLIKAFAQSPGGFEWGSINFISPTLSFPLIPKQELPFYPTLGSPVGSFKVDSNYGKPAADITASFKVTDLNLMQYSGSQDYEIGANFYEYLPGKPDKQNLVFIGQGVNKQLTTMKGQKYEFSIRDEDYKAGKRYKVVPYVKDKGINESKGYYHYDDNGFEPSLSKGCTMTNVDLFIDKYDDLYDKDPAKDPNAEEWIVVQQVQIANLAGMVDWSEWGVEVNIKRYDRDGNFISDVLNKKRFSVTEVVYENNVFMVFKFRVKPREKYDFDAEFTPYYIERGKTDPVYVKNSDLYEMDIKFVRDWEGENEQYWALDKQVKDKSGVQVVDMGVLK